MQQIKFSDVQVILVDSQRNIRHLLQNALHAVGFRNIQGVGRIGDLRELMTIKTPDLIIVDIDEDRKTVCQTIQEIRNRELGESPFVVVLALTWNAETEAINAALDAGTDDIVTKPVSARMLQDRVSNLVQNRKEFIVTSSYVGPDRRTGERRSSADELPSLKVPNSLRYKAVRDKSAIVDDAAVEETMRTLRLQKVFRIANDIGRVSHEIYNQLEDQAGSVPPEGAIKQLHVFLTQIERIVAEEKLSSVNQIVATTRKVLNGIVGNPGEPKSRQFEALRLYGQAIAAALRVSDDAAGSLVSELDEAAQAVIGAA